MFEVCGLIFNCFTVAGRCAILFVFALIGTASAQFSPSFPLNNSYWEDGKAEFDFYDAQIVRDGQPRQCEALVIFVRESIDAKTLARVDDPKKPDALATIRLHEIFTVPRGMFVEHQSLTAHWRLDFLSLAHLSLVGTDGIGNFAKRLEEKREANARSWFSFYDTYRDGAGFDTIVPATDRPAIFYDELPLRVRTIDFSKPNGEFEIQLAPSLGGGRRDTIVFKPAKVAWKSSERTIEVDLRQDAGAADHFVLDREFPFLLREWKMADGSRLKLKNSLRAEYWKYDKPGDRERALKDPMLRHPD
jgi:hypothetical protein